MEPSDPLQDTGRTTQQMKEAPRGALFIWCGNQTHYPRALARHLGREDLKIVTLDYLTHGGAESRPWPGVVLDHAAQLSFRASYTLEAIRLRVRP